MIRISTLLCLIVPLGSPLSGAAVVSPPTFRYMFEGTLDTPFLQYAAGTTVTMDIQGDASHYTGTPPSGTSTSVTRYLNFFGSLRIGSDALPITTWEVAVFNDWTEQGPTVDRIAFLAQGLASEPYFFFLSNYDETGGSFSSTELPFIDQIDPFYAEIAYEELVSPSAAVITPLSISTTVIPEPAPPVLLLGAAALLPRRRRGSSDSRLRA